MFAPKFTPAHFIPRGGGFGLLALHDFLNELVKPGACFVGAPVPAYRRGMRKSFCKPPELRLDRLGEAGSVLCILRFWPGGCHFPGYQLSRVFRGPCALSFSIVRRASRSSTVRC